MDPDRETRQAFGRRARELREAAGLSLERVAELMTGVLEDEEVSHQRVSGWERGEGTPRTHKVARALDEVLDAGGELLARLWPPDVYDRVVALEQEVAELREMWAEFSRLAAEVRRLVAEEGRRGESEGR